jgi:hypothetical protein
MDDDARVELALERVNAAIFKELKPLNDELKRRVVATLTAANVAIIEQHSRQNDWSERSARAGQ